MIRAFYSGSAGMRAQQSSVDVISNNIANLNTAGYKEKNAEFSDLLYSSMLNPEVAGSGEMLAGTGERVASTKSDMSPGTAQQTDRQLDFCIEGEGFFAVKDTAGNTFYTRSGSFSVSSAQGMYLIDSAGRYVLDASGNRILSKDGKLNAAPGVYDFSNVSGLYAAGDGLYSASNTSGAAASVQRTVKQGFLEASNVDLANQMTKLIMAQRGYQLSSGLIQNADKIEGMVNELGQ